ncbi:MAG: hypothetical protein BZ136_08295 [Methanosphaera sp. rholeuAM74]|nr:MAG: hypothetical protein BZ136_08295 [Methanosphaera sp. rholeuAM74]
MQEALNTAEELSNSEEQKAINGALDMLKDLENASQKYFEELNAEKENDTKKESENSSQTFIEDAGAGLADMLVDAADKLLDSFSSRLQSRLDASLRARYTAAENKIKTAAAELKKKREAAQKVLGEEIEKASAELQKKKAAAQKAIDDALEELKKLEAAATTAYKEALKKTLEAIEEGRKAGLAEEAIKKAMTAYNDYKKNFDEAADKLIRENAQKRVKEAVTAADAAATNPTTASVLTADSAVTRAQLALDSAKLAAIDTADMEKQLNAARQKLNTATKILLTAREEHKKALNERAILEAYKAAAKALPTSSAIKESDRVRVALVEKAYEDLTSAQKKTSEVKELKKKVDASRKAIDNPKITFDNAKVTNKLNRKRTKTTRIVIAKGKTLQLKAKSSTGALLTYKASNKAVKVNANGVITAKAAGKATVTVESRNSKVKVRITVK